MLRVCGADVEQTAHYSARCWCRGAFCGKGGATLSDEFRKEFKTSVTCKSLAEFSELVAQPELFRGDDRRRWWLWRLDPQCISWERSGASSSSARSSSSSASGGSYGD